MGIENKFVTLILQCYEQHKLWWVGWLVDGFVATVNKKLLVVFCRGANGNNGKALMPIHSFNQDNREKAIIPTTLCHTVRKNLLSDDSKMTDAQITNGPMKMTITPRHFQKKVKGLGSNSKRFNDQFVDLEFLAEGRIYKESTFIKMKIHMKHDHGDKHNYGHQWNREALEFLKDKYKKQSFLKTSTKNMVLPSQEKNPSKLKRAWASTYIAHGAIKMTITPRHFQKSKRPWFKQHQFIDLEFLAGGRIYEKVHSLK